MFRFFSSRSGRALRLAAGAAAGLALAFAAIAHAQEKTETEPLSAEAAHEGHGRILLVLPFDNRTGQLSLDWMREAAVELLNSRFTAVGFAPLSREDRMYALDHLGLPQGFQPSRASTIKLAQTLDADEIVVGSFSLNGNDLVAEARLVDVPRLRMGEPVTVRGKLTDMIAIFDSLAWELTKEIDPGFNVAEKTFVAAGAGLRLDAFEQYIRGITEPDQQERLRHLEAAVKLSSDFSPAWMAIGREEYSTQQYQKAADAFAKVDPAGQDGLEAGFYRGLSLLYSGEYADAEKSFAEVARILPLAEVLNNEGVAASREGHDGTAMFVRAAAADPNTADYHFNLAVSLKQHANAAAALNEMAECLKLHPGDSEAQSVLAAWKAVAAGPATVTTASSPADAGHSADADATPDPLERIVRTFDAAAFRQAGAVLDQVASASLAALPGPERAGKLSAEGNEYLKRGLVLEAERLYRSAIAADGNSAAAHAGLAEVRRRTGDATEARQEADEALKLDPSPQAYLVLSRLDLAAGNLSAAETETGEALKLAPKDQAAQQLSQEIAAKQGVKKEQP
ncbi:MAG: tetratricopeptide repeat protein [Terracidiphilus sp.]